MKKLTVVTGFSPDGYEEYGKNFISTFKKFWPLEEVELIVFVEDWNTELVGFSQYRLCDIPGCFDFIDRHRNNAVYCGEEVSHQHVWKQKEIEVGYSFKYDAVKFARQAYYMWYAATELSDTRHMVWLDGDVVTYKPASVDDIIKMIDGYDVTYLGRGRKHPEIGFQGYTLPGAVEMLTAWKNLYDSDEVFSLQEWHSAYAFKVAINLVQPKQNDLTPGGKGHVWFQSPLGDFTDHLKGPRKLKGYSKERLRK